MHLRGSSRDCLPDGIEAAPHFDKQDSHTSVYCPVFNPDTVFNCLQSAPG